MDQVFYWMLIKSVNTNRKACYKWIENELKIKSLNKKNTTKAKVYICIYMCIET